MCPESSLGVANRPAESKSSRPIGLAGMNPRQTYFKRNAQFCVQVQEADKLSTTRPPASSPDRRSGGKTGNGSKSCSAYRNPIRKGAGCPRQPCRQRQGKTRILRGRRIETSRIAVYDCPEAGFDGEHCLHSGDGRHDDRGSGMGRAVSCIRRVLICYWNYAPGG